MPLRRLSDWHVDTGERIRRARERTGLSQKAVADRLGISWQMFQRYELATGRLPADVLIRLPEILGAKLQQLVSPTAPPAGKIRNTT